MFMFNQFDTPEKALDHLLDKGEKSYRGSAHVWLVYRQLGSRIKATGAHPITRRDLENRIYKVAFCNDSVSIEFLDCIFINHITGRSFPDPVRCQVVRYPSNEVVTC